MVIAVAGSGGKTTLIKQLAAQYRCQGKSVFVTTTTHMFIEADTLLTDDPVPIIRQLARSGYAMAGIPTGEKIRPLSPGTYEAVCRHADIVLVEADGTRHMPLKFPAPHEPVIPANTDAVIVVWGPHALGKPAGQVCHRLSLAKQHLDMEENTIITMEHIRTLIQAGYLQPLRNKYPHVKISVTPPL